MRDAIFKPLGLFADVPGLKSGEVGLILILGVGLAFVRLLLPEIWRWRGAFASFALGFLISAAAVALDAIDDSEIYWGPIPRP